MPLYQQGHRSRHGRAPWVSCVGELRVDGVHSTPSGDGLDVTVTLRPVDVARVPDPDTVDPAVIRALERWLHRVPDVDRGPHRWYQ